MFRFGVAGFVSCCSCYSARILGQLLDVCICFFASMTPGVMEEFLVVYVQEVLREGRLGVFHFLLHALYNYAVVSWGIVLWMV